MEEPVAVPLLMMAMMLVRIKHRRHHNKSWRSTRRRVDLFWAVLVVLLVGNILDWNSGFPYHVSAAATDAAADGTGAPDR